jgi:hypothetical protein
LKIVNNNSNDTLLIGILWVEGYIDVRTSGTFSKTGGGSSDIDGSVE